MIIHFCNLCSWYIHTVNYCVICDLIAKTWHDDEFLEIQIFTSASSIYLAKALFFSNTNVALQILFELQS